MGFSKPMTQLLIRGPITLALIVGSTCIRPHRATIRRFMS